MELISMLSQNAREIGLSPPKLLFRCSSVGVNETKVEWTYT